MMHMTIKFRTSTRVADGVSLGDEYIRATRRRSSSGDY